MVNRAKTFATGLAKLIAVTIYIGYVSTWLYDYIAKQNQTAYDDGYNDGCKFANKVWQRKIAEFANEDNKHTK